MATSNTIIHWNNANGTNPKVDIFLSTAKKWKTELEKLRRILLDCQLAEELKWGVPVYTFQKKNIAGINGLKLSCALSFFKGALLNDGSGILIKPGENTQWGRWIKFTSVHQIVKLERVLKAYIYEAIEVEKAGLQIDPTKIIATKIPGEFQKRLDTDPTLEAAFYSLTKGRQRAYLLYFSAPKQSKTRESRVEKCLQQILNGKGLDDQ